MYSIIGLVSLDNSETFFNDLTKFTCDGLGLSAHAWSPLLSLLVSHEQPDEQSLIDLCPGQLQSCQ